jgi:hypothetical protein
VLVRLTPGIIKCLHEFLPMGRGPNHNVSLELHRQSVPCF